MESFTARMRADYIRAQLILLLERLPENDAEEIRLLFQDAVGWINGINSLVDRVLIGHGSGDNHHPGIVENARSPIHREWIDSLMEIKELVDLVLQHIEPVVHCRRAEIQPDELEEENVRR